MLNKNVHEIKKEIDENYSDIISYEEYTKRNTYSDGVKNYKFKVLLLKTKSDNKEFIKFMYSLTHDDIEIIDQYNSFDRKFQDELLEAASFPKNQHIFSQNILNKWFKPESPYYISQNSHNGKVDSPPARSIKNYLSEYNVFTRFIDNKVFTIETGFFKYIDSSFETLGLKADELEQQKNIKKNKINHIDKNDSVYTMIKNMYKFFSFYIKHTKGLKSTNNFGVDYLIEELMNFKNIKKSRDDTFSFFVSDDFERSFLQKETFLDVLFNNKFEMSYVTLSNKNDFNFSIGLNWCTHSRITFRQDGELTDHLYILFPISPTVAIVIHKNGQSLSKVINEKYYFDILMKQSLLTYLAYMSVENGVKILINGNKNYENYNKIMNQRGGFNHLQEYIDIDVTNKCYIDLISNKIDTSIISYAQNIYSFIEKSFEHDSVKTTVNKSFSNNIIKKIEIFGSIQQRSFYFNQIGNMVGFKFLDLDTGYIHNHGETD